MAPITCTKYTSEEEILSSDHKPVQASLIIPTKVAPCAYIPSLSDAKIIITDINLSDLTAVDERRYSCDFFFLF